MAVGALSRKGRPFELALLVVGYGGLQGAALLNVIVAPETRLRWHLLALPALLAVLPIAMLRIRPDVRWSPDRGAAESRTARGFAELERKDILCFRGNCSLSESDGRFGNGDCMRVVAIAFLAFALATFPMTGSAQNRPAEQPAPVFPRTDRIPGVDFAEGLSQMTGAAVSPVLGVTALGAWRYFKTPKHLRSRLPWFNQPFAWLAGGVLLLLVLLKEVSGAVFPRVVKKLFDAAELLVSKLSAALACAAFVPFIATEMAVDLGGGGVSGRFQRPDGCDDRGTRL